MMRNPHVNGTLRPAARLLYLNGGHFVASHPQSDRTRQTTGPGPKALPARLAARAGTVEATTAAAIAAFLRLGLIDGQTPAAELALIERGARRLALRVVGHFHKSKAARLAGGAIADQAD